MNIWALAGAGSLLVVVVFVVYHIIKIIASISDGFVGDPVPYWEPGYTQPPGTRGIYHECNRCHSNDECPWTETCRWQNMYKDYSFDACDMQPAGTDGNIDTGCCRSRIKTAACAVEDTLVGMYNDCRGAVIAVSDDPSGANIEQAARACNSNAACILEIADALGDPPRNNATSESVGEVCGSAAAQIFVLGQLGDLTSAIGT